MNSFFAMFLQNLCIQTESGSFARFSDEMVNVVQVIGKKLGAL